MQKTPLEEKSVLTLEETAALFGLSRRKLFRLAADMTLPFMAQCGKRKVIIRCEFEKYLNTQGVKEALANGKPRYEKRRKAQDPAYR